MADKGKQEAPKKKCAVCTSRLSSSSVKPLFPKCIDKYCKEDPGTSGSTLASVKEELISTVQCFKSMIQDLRSQSPALPVAQPVVPAMVPVVTLQADPARVETEEDPGEGASRAESSAEGDSEPGEENWPSKYKLTLEEVEVNEGHS